MMQRIIKSALTVINCFTVIPEINSLAQLTQPKSVSFFKMEASTPLMQDKKGKEQLTVKKGDK